MSDNDKDKVDDIVKDDVIDDTADNGQAGKKAGDDDDTVKSFTQEEVNAIVEKRLNRVKKDQPTAEELEAFRKSKEEGKTGDQKLEEVKGDLTKTQNELKQYKIEAVVLKNEVASDYTDFVMFEIEREDVEFEDITEYLKQLKADKPHLFKSDDKAPSNVGGKVSQRTGDPALSGVEQAFYERNPHLKKK